MSEKNSRNNMKKVTQKMIAEEAGVSLSCVTRYINGSGYVSEKKKEKVRAVMETLHYIPNQQAQYLRGGQSRVIGHIHTALNENFLFVKIASSIELESYARGYRTISYSLEPDNTRQLEEMMTDLLSYGVDGIIINTGDDRSVIRQIERVAGSITAPMVMIERPSNAYGIEKLLFDHAEGSYISTKKLYGAGHVDIAYLGVKPTVPVEQERYQGYVQAMQDINCAYYKSHSWFVDCYSVENGYAKSLEIFADLEEEAFPTAVFVSSDILAAGVYRGFMEMGIRIPEQISVVGYDDTIAQFLSPPLSTMRLPAEEIAETAVDILIRKIERQEQHSGNRTTKIGPVFIERNSIRKISIQKGNDR